MDLSTERSTALSQSSEFGRWKNSREVGSFLPAEIRHNSDLNCICAISNFTNRNTFVEKNCRKSSLTEYLSVKH